MHLRPDYAPVVPIPPLHAVDFGTDEAPKVRVSTATAHKGSDESGFAIGRFTAVDSPDTIRQRHQDLAGLFFGRHHEHATRAAEDSAADAMSRQRCEAMPWCSMHMPDEDKPSSRVGRTAICVTGQPRSLSVHPRDINDPKSVLPGRLYTYNHRWAGARRKRYPDNLIATSWHNNIYAPLSLFGGFDVFVVKQGPVRDAAGNFIPPRKPPATNGGYDALEPETVNWRGEPDNMFTFQKGEEFSLPVDDTSDTWRSYYMAVKFRNTNGFFYQRSLYVQSALWMTYDQLLCNEMIRNHSRATNTTYAYKMRLRTDYAPVAPFPMLHTVDFGTDEAPKVRMTTATVTDGGNEDSFAIGRTKEMDVYLDKYVRQHTWKAPYIWTTEAFVWQMLRNYSNASLLSHKGFGMLLLRVKNHTRGQPANTNFRQWLYNLEHRVNLPTGRPTGYPKNATQPVLSSAAPDYATYALHYQTVCKQLEFDCSRYQ